MNLFSTLRIGGVGMLLIASGTALAQSKDAAPAAPAAPAAAPAADKVPAFRSTGVPGRDTLLRLQKPITVDFNEQPLSKVMDFIRDTTGSKIEVLWKTDKEDGWDREHLVTMAAADMPALMFLEKLLQKMHAETGNDASWQLTELGMMQVGTKDRLNKFKRIEIYDINDLLFVMPVYNNAPTIDLQQVLQSSQGRGGGGSGQSPFQNNQNRNQNRDNEKPKEERATDLINLITALVENEQWVETGGSGGTIKYYQGNIIVNAPDYMHRALNGYPWWPSTRTTVTAGKRYVAMNLDSSLSKLERFEGIPVTGAVGGVQGGGGGGGGGGRR